MSSAVHDTVRAIIRQYGWNGTSYQIMNPGFSFWLDGTGDAVVGYVEHEHVRVVGGAPVAADDRLADVVSAFEQDAARAGCGVAYFAAEQRMAELAVADGRRVAFPIGAQPVWTPSSLERAFTAHASLRAQLSRARRKGVSVSLVTRPDAATRASLEHVLHEWIDGRGLPPLHFLVETDTLSDLTDRRLVVARRDGAVVAFLLATPVPARRGWLVEQLVRGSRAPNGTAELLLHYMASIATTDGASMITLGLAPLANRGRAVVDRAPRWSRTLLGAMREHGRRFYNFEGLERFKAKFRGAVWEPVYLILSPDTGLARALHAITHAFSGEPLHRFVPHALLRVLSH